MDKLRKVLNREEYSEEDSGTGIFSNADSAMTLNWKSRIQLFAICFVIGKLFSLLGALALFLHKGTHFAIFYSLGSIVSLASTCFLMGPFNQIKKMFASTRIIATIIYLVMIVLTLVSAMLNEAFLCFICIVFQSLAMTWYSLSYIPFARDAVKKTVTSCV